MRVVKTDRSRIETYQRCPRKRWLEYHYGGRGIIPTRLSLPLLTGSAVHEGLGLMFRCLREVALDQDVIDGGVKVAREYFQNAVEAAQIDLEGSEDQYYVAQEQMALAEGMIRAFAKTRLPYLLQEYEIVDVEREEEAMLAKHNGLGLRFMARVDAIVRQRFTDGDLHVWSLKTTSTWDKRKDKSAETDQQGLSEAWAVEQRLGEKVMGVQMIHLLKGRRSEHPKGSGRWVTFSPLIRGYRRHATVGTEYAHSWEWEDVDGSHRLGGKWERFDVWTDYPGGVKAWVDALDALEIQPQAPSPLEAQAVLPVPYFRQPEDMENWLEQTRAQELRVAEQVQAASVDGDMVQSDINVYFPQYRHSCHYPGDCAFLRVCFGSAEYRADPIATGDYKWREPNHPGEFAGDE